MRRRIVLLLAAMAWALVAASGAALAVNEIGTNGADTLTGINGDDNLVGRGLAAFETMRSREFRRELRVR